MTLHPCSDVSVADWIMAARRPWQQLVRFGPPGFRAYGRLRFLPDPDSAGQSENDVVRTGDRPAETEHLRAALAALAHHTDTPDDCYVCVWDGWGPASGGSPVRYRRKAVLPHRAYYLFRGSLSEVGPSGAAGIWPDRPAPGARGAPSPPDPAFVWPADRAWCLANDVDPHWAGIGADTGAIDALAAIPGLDVVPADPTAEQPVYR